MAVTHHVTDGLEFVVEIIDGHWVRRTPRSTAAGTVLVREASLLAAIADQLPVRVPRYRTCSTAGGEYEFIPGAALSHQALAHLQTPARRVVIEQLAGFLQALNSIDTAGITVSRAQRSRDAWIALFESAQDTLAPKLSSFGRTWVSDIFAPVLAGDLSLDFEPALIHGDLSPYHVLYDEQCGRLAGILDFGTAGLGDPATDVAGLILGYGEGVVREMTRRYPAIEDMPGRARFIAKATEISWAVTGLRENDVTWLTCHLGFARDW